MNRLQKKCFVAATSCHLLLTVILFVGPAFMSSNNKPEDFKVLEIVPDFTTDAKVSGGGTPNVTPPPPTPRPPTPQPQFTPPAPQPVRVEQVEPPKPKETQQKIERDAVEPKPDDKSRKLKISTTLVPRKTNNTKAKAKTSSTAEADSQARDNAKRLEAFNNRVRSLRDGLAPTTTVETSPGTGGGPSYANYKQVVGSIYFQAWQVPDDVNADAATAVATVTITREGNVISARLIRSSGNAVVDRSVQATLDRVKFIAPFPEGAKEQQRTFTINFNLKAKQLLG